MCVNEYDSVASADMRHNTNPQYPMTVCQIRLSALEGKTNCSTLGHQVIVSISGHYISRYQSVHEGGPARGVNSRPRNCWPFVGRNDSISHSQEPVNGTHHVSF